MIYDILMKENKLTVEYLESRKKEIFEIIPELKNEDGFEQNNNWHIYDVWWHTEVALSHSKYDIEERLALLLHDIGKPFSYQDEGSIRHFKGHAEKSAEISEPILKRLGYSKPIRDRILYLVKNHSTIINISNVNEDNFELVKKLLDVQYCDANAYSQEKIKYATQRLDCIKEKLDNLPKYFFNNNKISKER